MLKQEELEQRLQKSEAERNMLRQTVFTTKQAAKASAASMAKIESPDKALTPQAVARKISQTFLGVTAEYKNSRFYIGYTPGAIININQKLATMRNREDDLRPRLLDPFNHGDINYYRNLAQAVSYAIHSQSEDAYKIFNGNNFYDPVDAIEKNLPYNRYCSVTVDLGTMGALDELVKDWMTRSPQGNSSSFFVDGAYADYLGTQGKSYVTVGSRQLSQK